LKRFFNQKNYYFRIAALILLVTFVGISANPIIFLRNGTNAEPKGIDVSNYDVISHVFFVLLFEIIMY